MNLNSRIERIIHKIIKNNYIKKHIHAVLTSDTNVSFKKFIYLSHLIHSQQQQQQQQKKEHPENRTYISNKLCQYISREHYCVDMKIADIGGGNGDIIKEIGQTLSLPRENLYCIESVAPWSEPYTFTNNSFIQYIFWDNLTIPTIENNSLDIIFIMVTLHHMTDETIRRVFENIGRLAKPDSLLIIKEHDCRTAEDEYVINWEHHLYHLVEMGRKLKEVDIIEYTGHYIANYKSKKIYDDIIGSVGYTPILELNRLFERNADYKNPTNLYWKIYRRSLI
jgi:ubiquinone/menaquinone biosynthesis C-methylase UbiE